MEERFGEGKGKRTYAHQHNLFSRLKQKSSLIVCYLGDGRICHHFAPRHKVLRDRNVSQHEAWVIKKIGPLTTFMSYMVRSVKRLNVESQF